MRGLLDVFPKHESKSRLAFEEVGCCEHGRRQPVRLLNGTICCPKKKGLKHFTIQVE